MAEFNDNELSVFEKVMEILEKTPDFHKYDVQNMPPLLFAGLEIAPDYRKVYADGKEISMTAKEFEILYLLAKNRGRVLTYAQIYQKVWGDYDQNIQNNSIGSHVCSLRGKPYTAVKSRAFSIRCVREVGYCLETIEETAGKDE